MKNIDVIDVDIFRLNDNPEINHKSIENNKITIIDNFYKYPDKVREFSYKIPLINLAVSKGLAKCYRGAWANWNKLELKPTGPIQEFLSKLLNKDVIFDKFIFSFYMFDDKNYDKLKSLFKPHVDHSKYGGLVYLNKESDCRGGTGFYKKNDWNLTEIVKMKYNRFVIYPANIWHSVHISKGDFTDKYRVTQNFFIK